MPRSVRSYWVEPRVDGRGAMSGFGPKAKNGGMEAVVKMRHNGRIVTVAKLVFRADGDELTMDLSVYGGGLTVTELPKCVETTRVRVTTCR